MRVKKIRPRQGAENKKSSLSLEQIFFEIFRKKNPPREGDEKKNSPLPKLPTPPWKSNGASLRD